MWLILRLVIDFSCSLTEPRISALLFSYFWRWLFQLTEIENANPTTFLKYHNNPGKWAQQETLGRTRHMFGACMRSWRTVACRKADGLWEGWPLTSVPHGRIWRVFHVVRKAEKLLGTASDEAVQRFLHQLQLLNLSMELLLVPPQEAGDGAPTSAHREGSC